MSPELTALLTRINALAANGVCTPAEAVEHRRRALHTEVTIPLSRSVTDAVSLAGSAPRGRVPCCREACSAAASVSLPFPLVLSLSLQSGSGSGSCFLSGTFSRSSLFSCFLWSLFSC